MQTDSHFYRGQGATEYLVLLAVVLIVALVSVALLGFFPGMASDAQETQSKIYWQGASPIAITEWSARYVNIGWGEHTHIYMRIKNTGSYPIRLSKIFVNGQSIATLCTYSGWWCGGTNVNVMYLAPGDEKTFGHASYFPGLSQGTGNTGDGTDAGKFFVPEYQIPGSMSTNCSRTAPYSTAVMNGFGFEYIQYIGNTQLTKKQIGVKPVVIKCMNNYN